MAQTSIPEEPVAPDSLELIAFYTCPACHMHVPTPVQTQPCVITCPVCQHKINAIPVDETLVNFYRIMTAEGRAIVPSEYL